ncbi:MAG: ABC transporter permease [Bacteroidetes bacterium]|nr:ABC transporter permease [Bacteroidota bacterium]
MKPYFPHIDIYDLASNATLFSGLTLALLLALAKKGNQKGNLFLSLALAVIALKTGGLTPFLLPALGSLVYFYVRQLTHPELQFRKKDILHFCPLLVGYWMPAWVVISLILGYLYLSHRLIQSFYRRLKPVLMDRPRFAFRRVERMLLLLGLFSLLWLFKDIFSFAVAFALIGLAAEAVLKPDGNIPLTMPITDRADAREKGRRLKEAVAANRLYEDAELTLTSLAIKLSIHPHDLSRIINVGLEKNFSDFINEFRVREIARKMQDSSYDRLTLLGIAYESGFNSKTTFNRVFKETTGKTPLEYKNNLRKEVPIDKLAPLPCIRPVILRSESPPNWAPEKLTRNVMIRNYLKIAWRNILGNKVYSALNITGLATGMAVALLIGLWAYDQYSYDKFLPGYEQAYSVKVNFTNSHDGTHTQNYLPIPLADVLKNDVPGIKYVAVTDLTDFPARDFLVGNKKLLVNGGTVASDFLKIFQYTLLKGNVNNVLKDPFSIVIDESTAKSLFGEDDPIGKTIKIDNQHDVKVTGVMKDFPSNSTFQFHFLMPFSYAEQTEDFIKNARANWDNNSFEIFVSLQPGVTSDQVAAKIKNLIVENNPLSRSYKPEIFIYPLKNWHLYSDFKDGKASGGFISYVRMFSIIGGLVLLIACVNFVNLSTARSEKRAREVGVRKAIGSSRSNLIIQFLTESILITFLAFVLSVGLVQLALPYFNAITTNSVHIPYGNFVFWCIMISYVLITGLLAGTRPAFYLSAFNPVKILKGNILIGKTASLPRKILLVVQFTCSVAFIISTVIIYQQIQYAKNRPTGYSADRLVSTFMTKDLADHYDVLKNELMASRMVESVTKASSPVTSIGWHTGIDQWPGQNAGDQKINVGAIIIDNNYFKTVGMQLIDGHNFSDNQKADTNNVIVNESAVKRMGLKEPINQIITCNGIDGRSRIIGVVKDALMESPFTPVEPLVFTHKQFASQVIYRLTPGVDPHDAIEKIGKIFDKYNPAYPFSYSFVDETYNQKFSLETLVGKLAGIFAGLAIFVSCLGLFGLAAYVAEQRTKEIGIRKVLGASIVQVWMLLSGDFILLVTISCVIASPIALYFLSNWLQKYDYRVSIGPGVFLLSAIAAIVLTLITISFQSIKAALTNPVKSLRSE